VLDVRRDRARRDHERGADLRVRAAGGEQRHDLELARRQLVRQRPRLLREHGEAGDAVERHPVPRAAGVAPEAPIAAGVAQEPRPEGDERRVGGEARAGLAGVERDAAKRHAPCPVPTIDSPQR
jgi:hypothetical protein